MIGLEAPLGFILFKLDREINLWIDDCCLEAELASFRCLPVPRVAGTELRPRTCMVSTSGRGSREGHSKRCRVLARFPAEATLQLRCLHARRARRKKLIRALAIVRPLSPRKRAKLFGGMTRAAIQGLSPSAWLRGRIRPVRQQAFFMRTASTTKQGMSPAIIPNKNQWYASISYSTRI